jgi:hypothetical protein
MNAPVLSAARFACARTFGQQKLRLDCPNHTRELPEFKDELIEIIIYSFLE